MVIRTEAIQKPLGGSLILKGINTHIQSKEFVGIIGPNGCGKSTFLKTIYRVLKQDKGCILLDQENLQDLSLKESAKKMAVVAQHNNYNFQFTVWEMVLMGRAPYKKSMDRDTAIDYKIANAALEKVGMQDYKERDFASLSGGEQQRIILARALAQETPCLILDEPTNHLDIKYQLQLMNVVKRLEVTVVAAIHDLNIAGMYCDKIYAMKAGEILTYGTPEEVITPAMIKQPYEVKASVRKESDGSIHVTYERE